MEQTSLEDFKKMLDNHDFYWMMSDNARVADEGWRKQADLRAIAMQSIDHQNLYTDYLTQRFPNTINK